MNHEYWSSKWHGFKFGWYEHLPERPWAWHKDNWQECEDISRAKHVLFKFGNEWANKSTRKFQHPKWAAHPDWFFIDNPEIPHLLWPNPANPQGRKTWVRCVRGSLFTQGTGTGTQRVDRLLREHSAGKITSWCDLVPVTQQRKLPRHVLLCPVTAPNYVNYYHTTQADWIQGVTSVLELLGYTWEIRHKPGRAQRVGNQLWDQLRTGRYGATVSQHSVAAVESVCAGVPAVVTGPHSTGALATPWDEFVQGHVRTFTEDEVRTQLDHCLANCRHKSELAERIPL